MGALTITLGLTVGAGLAVEAEVERLGVERYEASLDAALRLIPELGLEGVRPLASANAGGYFFALDRRGAVVLQPELDAATPLIQPTIAQRMIATGSGTVVLASADGERIWCIYRPLESGLPGGAEAGVAGWAVPLDRQRAAVLRARGWWIAASVLATGLVLLLARALGRRTGASATDVDHAGEALATLDALREAVVATDRATRIVYWNRAAAELSPRTTSEAVTRSLDDALPLVDAEGRGLSRLIDAGSAAEHQLETPPLYSLPGTERGFEVTTTTSGEGVVLVLREARGHPRLDASSEERDRMEALGRVAARLVHDFNNILGSVRGNADLLLLDLPKDEAFAEMRESAACILEATMRGAELTARLPAGKREPGTSRRFDRHP